MGADYCSRVRC